MEYDVYKLISGREVKKYTGGFVILDNMIHTNPSIEVLFAVGYKPLHTVVDPEYDADTEYIDVTYTDEEEYIQQVKTVLPIPEEEEEGDE